MEEVENLSCGKWKIGREIGRGAYGAVYSASGPDGESAAVKICRRDDTNPDRYERELRGARLYQSIPPEEGLVRLLDLGVCEWGFYTVMELADDEFGVSPGESSEYRPKTLTRVIAGEKALPLTSALELGITIANGLVTLQRHHLLHRDVKPGNIIYVRGKPVLSDIGLLVEELDMGPTLEADTSDPLFPAWWRILNKATHPDPSRRYHSAKALLKDLKSLHRRSFLSFGSRITSSAVQSATRIAGLVFFVLLLLICGLIIWSNIREYRRDKENERNEAETVLQEFIRRRSEEEKADAQQAVKAIKSNLERTTRDLEKSLNSK